MMIRLVSLGLSAACVLAQPYPRFERFLEPSFGSTVSKLRQDSRSRALLFNSPTNDLRFDLPEAVSALENPREVFAGEQEPNVSIITTDIPFPAGVWPAPPDWESFLSSSRPVVVPSGRFPIKFTPWPVGVAGEVALLDGDAFLSISGRPNDEEKWYYQWLHFMDVNGDGRTDVLAARNREAPPPFDGYDAFWNQLVWFEVPKEPAAARRGGWPEHVLWNPDYDPARVNDGPALKFDVADVDGDGIPEICFAEFWGETLALFHTTNLVDPSALRKITLTSAIGATYGCKFVDANNDGRLDVLVSNHELAPPLGSIPATFAVVELPENFKEEGLPESAFPFHTLDTDFPNRTSPVALAVGFFEEVPSLLGNKPQLALATDGGGDWHLYTPTSQDPDDWAYTRESLGENECDFMAPAVYTEDEDRFLVCGCNDLGLLYGGRIADDEL